MTDRPRAFFAIDRGSATVAASVIGRIEGRWRLLASAALPAGVSTETLLGLLIARIVAADPALAADLGATVAAPGPGPHRMDAASGPALNPMDPGRVDWPRIEARTAPPGSLAILAPTDRRRALLEGAAATSGWRVQSGSSERQDALQLMTLALAGDVRAVLLGAGEPASPDEKRSLRTLAPLVAAVAARRPDVAIVLAGGAAQHAALIEGARGGGPGSLVVVREGGGAGPSAGDLRVALDGLRGEPFDSRRGVIRSTGTLARILERRVESVEIGLTGGARAAAGRWLGRDDEPPLRAALVAAAGLVREEPDDELLDGVIGWSSVPIDRPRLRDRLRDLWLAPWAEGHGEGALLRLTAARAALQRLVKATPDFDDLPAPDILVVGGGVWSLAPAPAVGIAVLDVVRRTGVTHLVLDHARLLGPLGTIADESERATVLADIIDDALVPLGTAVLPQGLRSGRFLGRVRVVRDDGDELEHELVAGRLVTLDVPPGHVGAAEFDFRDGVVLGGRGRRFAMDVAGGMGGVVVDLRDVPLRLPDGLERRRELLAAWQHDVWRPLEA